MGTAHAPLLVMPYATNADLPPPIRRVLPEHAQDIYREAFNHAFARYDRGDESRAHREPLMTSAVPDECARHGRRCPSRA